MGDADTQWRIMEFFFATVADTTKLDALTQAIKEKCQTEDEQRVVIRTLPGAMVEWVLRLIYDRRPGLLADIDAALPVDREQYSPSSQGIVVAIVQSAMDAIGCRLPDSGETYKPTAYWYIILGGTCILRRVALNKELHAFASTIVKSAPGNVIVQMDVLTRRGFGGANMYASALQLTHTKKVVDMMGFKPEDAGGRLFTLVADATRFMPGGVGGADQTFKDATAWVDHKRGPDAVAGICAEIGFLQKYADVACSVRGTAVTSTAIAFAWALFGMMAYLRRQG